MAITRSQQAKQMLQNGGMSLQDAKDMAPKGEFLAYINRKEADMLKKAGGSGIMTKAGIPSFVEYGGQSGFEGAKSTGTVGGDVDRGAQHAQEVAREKARQEAARQAELRKTVQKFEEEKRQEKLERFRKLNSPTRKFQNLITKISPVANFAARFGTLNTRDFFADKVAPPGFEDFDEEDKERAFQDYVGARNRGEIDAYGNPTNADKGEAGIDQARMGIPALAFQAPQVPTTSSDYYGGANPFDINRIAYRLMADGGAVMDDEPRQAYGLGKLVKKIGRTVKKVAKSPIGKAALAFGAYKLGGMGFGKSNLSLFERFGALSGAQKAMLGIGAASALAGFMTPEQEEEEEEYYRGEPLRFAELRPYGVQRFAEGGDAKEPVAKKVMPLIDMGGKEKDYRETGGFVDMGRMEKADDVPARLSKNEFVFTADAVRNAGDGSVDKGAEVMYNMMKNLEAGGEVSEESQGLEGARKMFQTSQRLEEVL
jgi:hypothetical protein